MTEKEFLNFLEMKSKNGRVPQLSGYVDSYDTAIQEAEKYTGGHSVLFEGHQMLPIKMVVEMGRLLLNRDVLLKTKEALLVILAHHPSKEALNVLSLYNIDPDEDLRYFARIALDECEMWNE
ncbi:MAG: hypothetical protein WC419_01370 [Candidatus Omnitrophota bacterium]|jgi:hypothetical protein|nr:hypothetical protein [Candidatus Omnitrophota bacterium]